MPDNATVHVIDDDEAMRDSLSFLLETEGFRPRLYESADLFLKALATVTDGCIVTDVRMAGTTGLELARRLKDDQFPLPVIVMTGHGDIPLAVEAMKAGVADFIEKPFSADHLVEAIRTALARSGVSGEAGARQDALDRLAGLSPRERDVLKGVVAGKANKIIAHDLSISPRTVEIYRANLMSKTGARNMPELMRIAMAAGL